MQDENKYQAVIHKANCHTYNFSCRAKKDSFDASILLGLRFSLSLCFSLGQDRVRVRYGVLRIEKSDYREEAYHLLELLDSPWAQ